MRFLPAIISALAVPLPLALGVGTAYVVNSCDYDIFVWSVGSNVGPKSTLHQFDTYSEGLRYDNKTGGISIKVTTKDNGLYDASPQLNFAYTLDTANNTVYYDLSDVFGDPFANETVLLYAKQECPSIAWPEGVPPAGSKTQACADDTGLWLALCGQEVPPSLRLPRDSKSELTCFSNKKE
ncbi:uncharacterized protein BDZ99DRAFT_266326 [Mytilinidion resinicola]|uniref:BYS1 domain protein n=1 Tax=Mytilinidion resinicola TaxID=574789 RepID=A0A6A6YUG9_9PEZI|nr:uncharacterized protein BDZ99DRAFT_266326 [Mytilinidion resinicola]KAF2812421.1 hypothetical protein BDZ99DRAFT_266326 [Mytilinidion resinicola]